MHLIIFGLESLPVRILQFVLLISFTAACLTGCEAPESKFVYNEKTEELAREVGDAVKAEVDSSFGSPKNSVAWLRMPVDYGTLQGEVAEIEAEESNGYQFPVEFKSAEGEEAKGLGNLNLTGLAIRWTSGPYKDGAQIEGGRRDGESLAALQVASWNAETGILSLSQKMDPPPSAKDTFEIVGHKLSSGRQLYAAHCQHCHGTSGDGNGPTARYLNPLPRDYRLGKFKFQSTPKTDKPTDDDLERIIRQGIPGTYMPSFLLLEDDELEAIVQYVKWLSSRGEYEIKLVNRLYFTYEQRTLQETIDSTLESELEDYEEDPSGDRPTARSVRESLLGPDSELAELPEIAETESKVLAGSWKEMEVVVPQLARVADTPESRARGRVLYVKNCAACHGATGKGDGEQVEAYMVNDQTREKYPEPGLFDDWGNPIKPRNLTRGIYRGGRRPVDLYRRLFEGINGTPMPAFKGKFSKTDKKEDSARIWDIVNYVYHIPFEGRAETPTTSPVKQEHASAASAER